MIRSPALSAVLSLCAGLQLAAPACAAEIARIQLPGQGSAITLGGRIEPGDETAFHALAEASSDALVVLTGPGGRVAPALAIGRELRARGLRTLVPAGGSCASACALIWLAGTSRLLGPEARIGFHALATPSSTGAMTETHAGDAALVRYLTDLGYAFDATATIVNTPSAAIRWFDAIELNANGIAAQPLPR